MTVERLIFPIVFTLIAKKAAPPFVASTFVRIFASAVLATGVSHTLVAKLTHVS